tara:strand:+ start:199 stop:432 length:234 start_codon:yes stop_codon:yes gene_type:complete
MKKEILKKFGNGQFFSGIFTKKDGTAREFSGRIINHERWTENTIGLYDTKKKQYRSMRTYLPFYFENKNFSLSKAKD